MLKSATALSIKEALDVLGEMAKIADNVVFR